MAIKKQYSIQPETAIASYDYTNVAEGTGTVIFYGIKDNVSGASSYKLTTNEEYSPELETVTASATTTTANFDTQPFNLPRILKGTAYVSIGMYNTNSSCCRLNVKFQHISGGTTTDISSWVYGYIISANLMGIMNFLPVSLTQTKIKKGDQIRLVVQFITKDADPNAFGHDPTGREVTGTHCIASKSSGTRMRVHLPFRIDL